MKGFASSQRSDSALETHLWGLLEPNFSSSRMRLMARGVNHKFGCWRVKFGARFQSSGSFSETQVPKTPQCRPDETSTHQSPKTGVQNGLQWTEIVEIMECSQVVTKPVYKLFSMS